MSFSANFGYFDHGSLCELKVFFAIDVRSVFAGYFDYFPVRVCSSHVFLPPSAARLKDFVVRERKNTFVVVFVI